jgi:catechol 2,3-dioxygenase-like lactoylglutathione lyase family enzyme
MRQGEVTLELYEFPAPALAAIRARANGHVDHVAFDTADIEVAFATLKSAGYTIDEPAPVFLAFWTNGCRYFNVIGPDGERLEFNQVL